MTRTQTRFLKVTWLVGSRSRKCKRVCDRKQDRGHHARRKVWLARNAMLRGHGLRPVVLNGGDPAPPQGTLGGFWRHPWFSRL